MNSANYCGNSQLALIYSHFKDFLSAYLLQPWCVCYFQLRSLLFRIHFFHLEEIYKHQLPHLFHLHFLSSSLSFFQLRLCHFLLWLLVRVEYEIFFFCKELFNMDCWPLFWFQGPSPSWELAFLFWEHLVVEELSIRISNLLQCICIFEVCFSFSCCSLFSNDLVL